MPINFGRSSSVEEQAVLLNGNQENEKQWLIEREIALNRRQSPFEFNDAFVRMIFHQICCFFFEIYSQERCTLRTANNLSGVFWAVEAECFGVFGFSSLHVSTSNRSLFGHDWCLFFVSMYQNVSVCVTLLFSHSIQEKECNRCVFFVMCFFFALDFLLYTLTQHEPNYTKQIVTNLLIKWLNASNCLRSHWRSGSRIARAPDTS